MMLIDKGYYDYDYQDPKAKSKDVAPKSAEDTKKMLARFGVGVNDKKTETAEDLQRLAMSDAENI